MTRSFQSASAVTALARGAQEAFDAHVVRLERQIEGRMAFAACLVETGEEIAVNAAEWFPMASTNKVAIAAAALALVDRGLIALDAPVAITAADLDHTGPIARSVRHYPASLSLADLIELMLVQSNNNATDRVLGVAGGPAAVATFVRAQGIEDMRFDGDVNAILNRFFGFPENARSYREFVARYPDEAAAQAASFAPNAAFDADPRDTTTPAAMVDLLRALFAGQALSDSSRDFLIGVMERCETGRARLRGMLPAGTPVADKTGTIGGTASDVGVITLPDGRGRLMMAVYLKGCALPVARRESAIADLARSVYDYFCFR